MSEKFEEFLKNAESAYINGQYEAALELCEKAIAEDSSNADAYTGAGKACLVLNRLLESEEFFLKAVELDSENGEKYFDLANIKFGLENYTEALSNYAKVEQYGCQDDVMQKVYYQIGMISHMTGDMKSALLNFEKAEKIGAVNADTKEILLKRLQIYIESQDFVSAENYAIQLKMLAPGEFRSYQICFQILVALGKYEKAEQLLEEAEQYADINSDIGNKADICFNKAIIFAVKADNEPEKAADYYQAATAVFDEFIATPDLPDEIIANVAFSKAEIYLKLEKFDDALQCVEGITATDETQEKINFIKLSCHLAKDNYGKAEGFAEELKQSSNEYYVYFATYADAFIAKKIADKDETQKGIAEAKYNNAIAFFRNKAFEKPQDVFASIFRVRIYAENGKFAKAEELIKILPDVLKAELSKYVSECKNER
jgi:tetratricopeptide (TPR) repeat protein